MTTFAHQIIEALDEAAVELAFRLEDVIARRELPYPETEQSVRRTLEKVRHAREYLEELMVQTRAEMEAEKRSRKSDRAPASQPDRIAS